MSELDHELALTAEQQLALVTLDDVRRAGGGRDHPYDRARAGRIERVAPTVYRVRGAPPPPDPQPLAHVLSATGPESASHRATATPMKTPCDRDDTPVTTDHHDTRHPQP